MFTHILIPTDGSEVAALAVTAGLEFAKEAGARVTAYCASDELRLPPSQRETLDEQVWAEYAQHSRALAEQHVAAVRAAALAAGVGCATLVTAADTPYEGIVAAAGSCKCDVIFMASHGRGGIAGLILGSVTQKVITHSKIPVLVYR